MLENSKLPLYMTIGSQLRYLYHLNRGELAEAEAHRETVEMHAARVGSAWQVELWESASLLPFYIATEDVVQLSRIAQRLSEVADEVPSMWRYRELAFLAMELQSRQPGLYARLRGVVGTAAPRSFIGWSTTHAGAALYFNQRGEHAMAHEIIDSVRRTMTDDDREYVTIFLLADIQAAEAHAGLGAVDEALDLLEHLLSLYRGADHPLALGLVHEARARIAWKAGRRALYAESAAIAARLLKAIGAPTLVARADELARLASPEAPSLSSPPPEQEPKTATAARSSLKA